MVPAEPQEQRTCQPGALPSAAKTQYMMTDRETAWHHQIRTNGNRSLGIGHRARCLKSKKPSEEGFLNCF